MEIAAVALPLAALAAVVCWYLPYVARDLNRIANALERLAEGD